LSDDDIARLSYEEALAELDTLIARLEGGAVQLDEAIACYERGSRLAQRCAELLDRTEQAVMQLVVGGSGRLEERPLGAEAGPPGDTGPGGSANPSTPTPRPVVPPPPGAPLRARAAREQAPDPGLFPGLEPAPRPGGRSGDIDPDDIPF